MAAGLPVVASPVGMNTEVVEHERNGLLASDTEEWRTALEQLIEAPAFAAQLAESGRQTVVERYGYATRASCWRDFLRGVSTSC
jgi:glycosyltransferase involved in cell wall biosynthesis